VPEFQAAESMAALFLIRAATAGPAPPPDVSEPRALHETFDAVNLYSHRYPFSSLLFSECLPKGVCKSAPY
jgi:hypothetical protein